jgi:tripartite ATP-independent transporter DctP family solute receptor
MKRTLMGLVLVAIIGLLAGCAGGGEGGGKTVLTFPHVLNAEHPVHKAIVKFAEEVATRSGGTMEIKIFEGGTMGSEQELVDNVAIGTNDMTKVSSTILENKTELAKVYTLPYLFRDEEHMWKVLDGEVGRELLDMAIDKGLKGVCYYDAGFRSFYTKDGFVDHPDKLTGQKIRVQKSPMMEKLISTLGASPQAIAFSELYSALDTGVVDGAENNIPSYYTTQHYKVAGYYTYDEHVAVPDIVLINSGTWESLTPEQQKILMDSAAASSKFQRDLWKKVIEENVAKMKEEGVQFTRPEKEPFVEKTKPIYNAFEGTEVMKYVERIRAVQ